MRFETEEVSLTLSRDYYCYATPENGIYFNDSGTEVQVVDWSYSNADGSGLLLDEYIAIADVRRLRQRIKELEFGTSTGFEMHFFQFKLEKPFIRIKIRRPNDNYHLKLDVYDTVFSEYISINKIFTPAEWQPYAQEFMEWGKKQPVRLGAKVRTQVHKDDNTFWLGRTGTVVSIYPKEKKEDIARVRVSFSEFSSDGKPYQMEKMYDIDEVKILSSDEEPSQEDLNRDLVSACTAKEADFTQIERLLQQGAQPLGAIDDCGDRDLVYNAVIEEYFDEDDVERFDQLYRITELFLQYGMDFSKPAIPYDSWLGCIHPLWHFAFFHTNAVLKVLKLMLDRGMDAEAAGKCWGHDLTDLSIASLDENDNIHKYIENELARLMLFASYPHVLNNDPDLQAEIQMSRNNYAPVNFRNWEKFYYKVDTSQRPDTTRLSGIIITIFERGTGKEVWQFVFE